jgi:FMN phosphatase YigB (HAD superfamily)
MRASETAMIGGWLSKDIRPARLLGAKTIRIAPGGSRGFSRRGILAAILISPATSCRGGARAE